MATNQGSSGSSDPSCHPTFKAPEPSSEPRHEQVYGARRCGPCGLYEIYRTNKGHAVVTSLSLPSGGITLAIRCQWLDMNPSSPATVDTRWRGGAVTTGSHPSQIA